MVDRVHLCELAHLIFRTIRDIFLFSSYRWEDSDFQQVESLNKADASYKNQDVILVS